jgi:putative glutamine amidotransferase
MKLPLIGLTMDHSPATDSRTFAKGVDIYYLNDVYIRYMEKAPCLCIGLPTTDQLALAQENISNLDGLLLTGGNDVYSGSYGESTISDQWQQDRPRTFYEIELIKQALQQGKPILGICRGFQMLNVALGGSLYQDIATQTRTELQHRSPNKPAWNRHPVKVLESSYLYRIIGQTSVQVNTSHHQAIKTLAAGLTAVAWTPDGIIEGIESAGQAFVLGVQWHPEAMADEPSALALVHEFVRVCSKGKSDA